MNFLGVLLGKFLDPVNFIVVLIITTFSREKWIIVVAAICAAVFTETVLTLMQQTRPWGYGIISGIIVSLLQAVLSFRLVGRFRKPKKQVESKVND